MKTLLLLIFTFALAAVNAQDTTLTPVDSIEYNDTVRHFYILFLRADTTQPYATRHVNGYIVLWRNVAGKNECGLPILQSVDPLIYLDERKKPIDWGKYERYEERAK